MKLFLSALIFSFSLFAFSQEVNVQPAAQSVAISQEIPKVQVAEPAAPPKWAEDVIVQAEKLPVVGPIVSKVLLYSGILSAILTSLIAFLLTSLYAVSKISQLAGANDLAAKVEEFKNGKVMYWLKYLSMFNAKKPEPKNEVELS